LPPWATNSIYGKNGAHRGARLLAPRHATRKPSADRILRKCRPCPYLQLLREHCGRHAVRIAGYCLMSNHVHLLAIPHSVRGLANALGRAHTDYARWHNVRLGDPGHVWQNRFYSCPPDERHRWEALRYLELNPVRAGLAGRATDWPWSSGSAHGRRIEPGLWT